MFYTAADRDARHGPHPQGEQRGPSSTRPPQRYWQFSVVVALTCVLPACQPKAEDAGDTSDGPPMSTDDTEPALQDPGQIVEGDLDCEGAEYGFIPGATSYFRGDYQPAGTDFSGTERWFLFANDTWTDMGGSDCVIVYDVVAEETEPISCDNCNLGLNVVLTVNNAQSTCPVDLSDGTGGATTYSVARNGDTTSHWYFSSSGELFGSGHHAASGLNFITEPACKWF